MKINQLFFALLASALTAILIFFITPTESYTFSPQYTPTKEVQASDLATPLAINFIDSTLQSQLFFNHQQGNKQLTGLNESLGSGACVLDYDSDSWQDLFIVNGSGSNRFYGKLHWWQQQHSHQLFRNTGQGKFTNTTKQAGLDIPSWGMGCIATDFNNDGSTDLLITTLTGELLFKNNADGSFSKVNSFTKHSAKAWSTSACAADFDNDGLVDLYIAHYINFDKTKLNYEAQSEFNTSLSEFFNPSLFSPISNRLYKNTGNFSFIDITQDSGLIDSSSRSLAVRCQDINNDHLADIIVANEKGDGSNRLYINQGNFSFVDSSQHYQFQNNTGSRSIAIGDINNNGTDELLLMTGALQNNRLYQAANNTYIDTAREWGLTDNTSNFQSNWGGGLHDFNQDGLLDLFIVNGFLTPDPDTQRVSKAQPNRFWLNTGKQFVASKHFLNNYSDYNAESSRSSVFADFDNDGDMDIYISNNNNLGQLLINDTHSNTHWLGVNLFDSTNSTSLVGTKVSIRSELGQQSRTISAGDSFLSDSDDRLLFGLKHDTLVKQLTITWPNAQTQHFYDIGVDQYINIGLSLGRIGRPSMPHYTKIPAIQNSVSLPNASANTINLFLSLIKQSTGMENSLAYIRTALASSNPLLREAAIKQLAGYNHPHSLALLTKHLDDPVPPVAISALEVLCSFESESTIRWLIAALSDKRDTMKIAAAHCFAHLYHEEEAMIHRKYLALPALIQLLTDPNNQVKIAAARALAEAERYRAVTPLINLLTSEDIAVRIAAIRSLGLIREKLAIPPLLARLQSNTEAATAYAHILIALQRLGYKDFKATLNHFFQAVPPFATIPLKSRVDSLLYLSQNSLDSIVIPRLLMSENTQQLISKNMQNTDLLTKLIPTINSPDTAQLISLSKSAAPEVRLQAYISLLNKAPKQRINVLKQVAQENSNSLKNKLLQQLSGKSLNIPTQSLSSFLIDPNTSENAILALAKINNPESTQLLLQALKTSSHQALILKTLENNRFTKQNIAKPYLSNTNPNIKQAAYHFYLNKFAQNKILKKMPVLFMQALNQETEEIREIALNVLTTRKELWAVQKLQQLILDRSEDSHLRLKLLKHYQHPFQNNWLIMLTIAKTDNDPINAQVIELLSHYDAPKVTAFYKELALKDTTPEHLKNLAFNTLAKKHPQWVIETLISSSSHH